MNLVQSTRGSLRFLVRCLASAQLLLQRRIVFFLAADGMVLFVALISTLVGGGRRDQLWHGLVLVPYLVLGIPVLADVVDVERRVGSLDLALSSPGAAGYFERRLFGAGALYVLQGWLVVLGLWLATQKAPFPILIPLFHCLLIVVLIAAVVLFWAVRLRGAGAVTFASYLSVALLSKWLAPAPFPDPFQDGVGHLLLPLPSGHLSRTVVLVGVIVLLYSYARRRLKRPELLLG